MALCSIVFSTAHPVFWHRSQLPDVRCTTGFKWQQRFDKSWITFHRLELLTSFRHFSKHDSSKLCHSWLEGMNIFLRKPLILTLVIKGGNSEVTFSLFKCIISGWTVLLSFYDWLSIYYLLSLSVNNLLSMCVHSILSAICKCVWYLNMCVCGCGCPHTLFIYRVPCKNVWCSISLMGIINGDFCNSFVLITEQFLRDNKKLRFQYMLCTTAIRIHRKHRSQFSYTFQEALLCTYMNINLHSRMLLARKKKDIVNHIFYRTACRNYWLCVCLSIHLFVPLHICNTLF